MKKNLLKLSLLTVVLLSACDHEKEVITTNHPTPSTSTSTSSNLTNENPESIHSNHASTDNLPISLEELYPNKEDYQYAREMIGTNAPLFTLKNVEGENVSLVDFKGDNVILELAMTTCIHCENSQPEIQSFKEANPQITFLQAFSVESTNDVKNFLVRTDSSDNKHVLVGDLPNNLFEQYKVKYTPTLLFINKEGIINLVHVGGINQETLQKFSDLAFP